jgi:hypothetical protein
MNCSLQCSGFRFLSSSEGSIEQDSFLREANFIAREFVKNKISWFAVPTKNRVALLGRCLNSFLENFAEHNRNIRVLVSDDSDSPDKAKGNRMVVDSVCSRYGVEGVYQGKNEKYMLMSHLGRHYGGFEDVIKFALFGDDKVVNSFGANRNFIFLRTSGCGVMSSDDDVVCDLFSIDCSSPSNLSFDNASLPHWFYPSRRSALDSLIPKQVDLLGEHESVLGLNVGKLNREFGLQLALSEGSEGAFASSRDLNLNAKVAVVSNGVVGDCGYSSFSGIVSLTDNGSMERLTKSEASYKVATKSREVVRQARSLHLSAFSNFISTSFSFESIAELPPFFPNCRNEDGIFANMLGLLFSSRFYLANLPLSLVHSPEEERYYSRSHIQLRFAELMVALMLQWKNESSRSERGRLVDLGTYLIQIGTMDSTNLFIYLRHVIANYLANKINYLSELLIWRNFSPDYWVDDISDQILYLERAIVTKAHFLPTDILEGQDRESRLKKISKYLNLYGNLLRIWPDLMLESKRYYAQMDFPVGSIIEAT